MNLGTWLPLVVIAVLMALRLRRASREQPLVLNRMWLMPAVAVLLIGMSLSALPPPLVGWAALAAGLAAGAPVGWHRGKLMQLRINPADGRVLQKASPAATVLLVGIVVLRMGLRDLVGSAPGDPHPALLAVLVTDGLMGFAVGLLIFTRVEMYLRARRLLEGMEPA